MGRPRIDPTEYQIEKIVDHRVSGTKKKRIEYRIKWGGYSSQENSWEPGTTISQARGLMKQYWARRGGFSARDALLGKVPPSPAPKEKKQKTKRLLNREKKNVSYGTRSATDSNYVHRSLSRFKRLNTASYQRSIPDKIAMETPSADIPSPHVHTTPVSPPTTLERRPSKEDPWVLSRTLSQRTLISKEEEEDMDEEYEASDVIYQLDYRGDWDWPKDVLRLIKLQRSLSGELQALIRWKDGPVACYDTNYIKQRHPYLLLKYYEDRLVFK